MLNWLEFLRSGLSRKRSSDPIDGQKPQLSTKKNLENLRPFFLRHWRAGAAGLGLVLFGSLLSFPQPLINRFVIDDVILAKRLDLLPLAIILLVSVKLLSMGAEFLQQYYFTRFEQKVMLDMQQTLLDHTLRLPKAFFDDNAVGYLVSRLVSNF
jgi:ABC-type bacteriocin/lantibiotic exporter with double-glycine peptidase domain